MEERGRNDREFAAEQCQEETAADEEEVEDPDKEG